MTEPRAVELDLEREAAALEQRLVKARRSADECRATGLSYVYAYEWAILAADQAVRVLREAAAELRSLRERLAARATPSVCLSVCPLCLGSGIREAKGPENAPLPVSTTATTFCHGCGGRGWV